MSSADATGDRLFPDALRGISINSPALLFTTDAWGNVVSVNSRWTSFVGVDAQELLGTRWTAFIYRQDMKRIVDEWSRHVVNGEPYLSQCRLRRADGTYRWTEIRAEAQRDGDGNIEQWFGSGNDVDVQRRAIDALEFLAQTGATVAGAQDVTVVLDRLAHASLEGLADISIFDLEEEDGSFRRLVVASNDVPHSAVDVTLAFQAPQDRSHPIARAMRTGETVHIPDVDEAFIARSVTPPERQTAWRLVDIRSLVSAPMMTPGGALGALTLIRTGVSVPFEASDVRVVEEVARRAAVAIANIRFKDRERRAARNLQAFADMGESFSESLGLAATMEAAMRVVVPARADWAFINLIDERGELRLAAAYHPDDAKRRRVVSHLGERFVRSDGEGVTPAVVRTRSPIFRQNVEYAEIERNVRQPILEALWGVGVKSAIVVPLFSGPSVRGTLHLYIQDDRRAFTQDDVEFFVEFARRLAPAIANAELFERERRVAQSFQEAALPRSLPEIPHFVFRAIYEAGRAEALVGGDWYDAFSLADGRIVVSVGDVAGSGLTAAVTMARLRQAIRSAARVRADPGLILDVADMAVEEDAERRFVTAFVGVLDPATAMLHYQSAGHPSPILRTADGALTELLAEGAPLGLRLRERQQTRTQHLPYGSLLALYTDGLTESTRDILEGERRLRSALADDALYGAENPAKLLHDTLLTDGSRDDVAILTITVT
jgi:PAS domain S-box-containing protein